MTSNLESNMKPFDTTGNAATLNQQWTRWITRFENYLIANGTTASQKKRALLLHMAGEQVFDIYETLQEETDDYAATKKKLEEYFKPANNIEYQILQFRRASQETD